MPGRDDDPRHQPDVDIYRHDGPTRDTAIIRADSLHDAAHGVIHAYDATGDRWFDAIVAAVITDDRFFAAVKRHDPGIGGFWRQWHDDRDRTA